MAFPKVSWGIKIHSNWLESLEVGNKAEAEAP